MNSGPKRSLLAEDNPDDGAEALDYIFHRGMPADRPAGLPVVAFLDLKMPRVASPLIRPAAIFSPPPRNGEGARRGVRLAVHRLVLGIVTSLLLLFALSSSQPRVVISEIHPHRDSGEQFRSEPQMRLSPEAFADTGQLRVRARYRDNTGRWSHWSEPVPLTGR